jgi:hypothetical protein
MPARCRSNQATETFPRADPASLASLVSGLPRLRTSLLTALGKNKENATNIQYTEFRTERLSMSRRRSLPAAEGKAEDDLAARVSHER